MKKILAFLIIPSMVMLCTSCFRKGNTISIHSDNESMDIRYSGEISFNETETAIQRISPNGYLKFKKNDKEMVAESNYHGEITYRFYLDGDKVSLDEQDRNKFIASVIKDLISMGFDANNRFDRIYKRGGTTAILSEVDSLRGDYVKALYLDLLLSTGQLTQADLANVAHKIAKDIGGDFEKGQLLGKFREISDSNATEAYLQAAKSIGSDFEKANALRNILNEHLSPVQAVQTLAVIKGIGSDFEKSQLLSQASANYFKDSTTTLAYLDAAKSIGSDFEKANALRNFFNHRLDAAQVNQVLAGASDIGSDFEKANIIKELIEKEQIAPENYANLLTVTSSLGSDFEKSNIVKDLIEKKVFSGDNFTKLLNTIEHIGSDFEKTNALKKLAEQNMETEDQWIGLINASAQIESSFERGNVLVQIAGRMPKTEPVRNSYMKAAKTIPEDSEYGRVMKAME